MDDVHKSIVSELHTIVEALWILFKSNGFPACNFYVNPYPAKVENMVSS